MLDTVLSGIGRNPGPTTNEAGCIRPEGKNVPGAGRLQMVECSAAVDVTTYHQLHPLGRTATK